MRTTSQSPERMIVARLTISFLRFGSRATIRSFCPRTVRRGTLISGSSSGDDRERVLLRVDAKIGSFDGGRRLLDDVDDVGDGDDEDDDGDDGDDDDDDDRRKDDDDADDGVDDDDAARGRAESSTSPPRDPCSSASSSSSRSYCT